MFFMEENESPPKNLNELLDRFDEAAEESEKVSLDVIMDAVGRRSFGPLLLLAGLIISSPGVGDIPGVPTILGLFVLMIAGQLVFGRDHFWLPQWLLKRSVSREKLKKMTSSKWVRKPARFVDRLLKERLEILVGQKGTYAIAIVSSVISLAMPLTEFVPLSANGVGAGIVAFGVALIARDGLMALIGYVIAAATITLATFGLT